MKIGLYFGSFNPVHIGHMAIAGYLSEYADFDQVWFVISPLNPLKTKESLLPDHHRLHMVNLAIGDNDRLKASDIEFKMPIPSYTCDTLAWLREKHPGNVFSLIMGEDNLNTLHKWKNALELVRMHSLYVYPRTDTVRAPNILLDKIIESASIVKVNAPLMQISGTFIRNGIKTGKDMSYFLPGPVWRYIKEMHFYEKKK
jgi:nicotinate-nucleotide adenylyltransferase